MNSIAFIYIGEPRFQKLGKHNHKMIFDKLKELNIKFNIYDFTSKKRITKYTGLSQVTNFFNSIEKTNEHILVKMRTDMYMSDEIKLNIIKNIQEIIKDNSKVFGYKGKNKELKQKYKKSEDSVFGDYVIIIHRNNINYDKDNIYKEIKNNRIRDAGHRCFPLMIKNKESIYKIFGKIFPIRIKMTIKNQNMNLIIYYYYVKLYEFSKQVINPSEKRKNITLDYKNTIERLKKEFNIIK